MNDNFRIEAVVVFTAAECDSIAGYGKAPHDVKPAGVQGCLVFVNRIAGTGRIMFHPGTAAAPVDPDATNCAYLDAGMYRLYGHPTLMRFKNETAGNCSVTMHVLN